MNHNALNMRLDWFFGQLFCFCNCHTLILDILFLTRRKPLIRLNKREKLIFLLFGVLNRGTLQDISEIITSFCEGLDFKTCLFMEVLEVLLIPFTVCIDFVCFFLSLFLLISNDFI